MKIPTPTTWETELSERGNRPEVWEKLIHTGSGLPYMALLRNLRNIIKAGVNDDTHEKVQFTVQDPERVISSRQFPIRWLAAFDVLRQIGQEMQKKPEDQPEEVKKKRSFTKNRKLIPCPNPPTKDLLIRYKDALDSAIKVATTENVSPIPGNTVIFCDVSGSMAKPVNGGSGLGAFNDGRRIGILMGLMLRFVSETSDFKIFSSPKDNSESYLTVDIEGDDILGNMNNVLKQMTKLGTATHFPFSYFTDLIEHSKHIDTFIIISDMMIAPGRYELGKLQWNVSSILNFYRKSVNPDLLFVSIDVGSSGRKILGAELEDDFRNVLISGYSDAILRLVSEMQNSQVETIKETAYEYLEKKTKS